MAGQKILLVEDCQDLRALVKEALGEGYRLEVAGTIQETGPALARGGVDLIILDVMLPDGNGFELCSQLKSQKEFKDIPVIFLTGKSDAMDKVLGFSIGAEDYVVKPFDPFELKARVQARLRAKEKLFSDLLFKADLKFDRMMQKAWILERGQEKDLSLTPFEFRLLYLLASREHEVFDRASLLKNLLDTNVHISEETIYTHVSALRRKLGSRKEYIECIPRVGYRFRRCAER